jgi:hypothetical protein
VIPGLVLRFEWKSYTRTANNAVALSLFSWKLERREPYFSYGRKWLCSRAYRETKRHTESKKCLVKVYVLGQSLLHLQYQIAAFLKHDERVLNSLTERLAHNSYCNSYAVIYSRKPLYTAEKRKSSPYFKTGRLQVFECKSITRKRRESDNPPDNPISRTCVAATTTPYSWVVTAITSLLAQNYPFYGSIPFSVTPALPLTSSHAFFRP